MKNIILILLISVAFSNNAQEISPFKSIGKEVKILTMSKGKYTEVHINDSLQRIGSVIVNMNTGTIYELLNTDTLYSEATLDPTVISRWYSPDPAASKYPGDSPYMFAGNNPIFYVDHDGKWKVRFRDYNDHSAGVVFVAEPGDNLETLAIQMGLPYKELVDNNFGGNDFTLNAPLEGGEWLRQEDLLRVEPFQNINKFLKEGKDNPDYNCAAFCIFSNEGEVDGWVDPDNMDDYLRESFENLDKIKDAQIGDVVTLSFSYDEYVYYRWLEASAYGYTKDEFNEHYDSNVKNDGDHYTVILLKTKDGNSIQNVIQKSGTTPLKITDHPGQPSSQDESSGEDMFTPSPINQEDKTPVYHKKEKEDK